MTLCELAQDPVIAALWGAVVGLIICALSLELRIWEELPVIGPVASLVLTLAIAGGTAWGALVVFC